MEKLRFKKTNGESFPLPISGILADISISSSSSISQDSIEKDFGEFPIYGANGEIKKISKYEKESSYVAIVKDGAGVGRVIIANPFSSVIGTMNYIENKPNCNLLYLYYLLQKLDFAKYVVGSGIPHIYFKDYKHAKIKIPTLKEQEKIGSFLSSFDKLIEKQQEKIGLLKELKTGYLQQMFPASGSNFPKIRFKGFTNNWEQRELSELAQITMGQSPNGINYTSNPEDHILVQGNADMENGWVNPRVWTTQITKIAEPNDLIFSVRAPVGAVGKTKFKAVIGRGVASIRGNEFVFQELLRLNMNNYWKTISTGSTFDSINSTELKTTIVRAPKIDEQNKIGGFLNSIDSLITLHQCKLGKFNELKRAYMKIIFT